MRALWAVAVASLLASCSTASPSAPQGDAPGGTASSVAGAGAGSPNIGGAPNSSGGEPSRAGSGQAGSSASGGGGAGGAGGTSQVGGSATAGSAGSTNAGAGNAGAGNDGWVGTWAAAQQLTEEANEPPAPGLSDNTLRQIVKVSIGGQRLRLRLSNEYGTSPVTVKKVHCAVAAGGSSIVEGSSKELSFAGSASVTIPAKAAVFSDGLDFSLTPLAKVAVSVSFGATSGDVTGHPGSRTTSYLQTGDAVAATSLSSPVSTDHWYILSGIDVMAGQGSHALVILGDSITDGRGSTTNGNDRWPDALSQRLRDNPNTTRIGVLNQGIGGNNVLSGGLGPTATARFDSDVLKQSGVRWLIVFEGVNDIGASASADSLISAYQLFVSKAHDAGIQVFGATILPFKGHSHYSAQHEAARTALNEWIRKPGNFDATIDMDAAVRDPQQPDTLLDAYDSGDHLHLNPAGYRKLAETVDLTLFE